MKNLQRKVEPYTIKMFKHWSNDDLKNAIWTYKNGNVPVGGYELERYEDELERRTGSRKGFHEE